MRNKGIIVFLTVVVTLLCLYYLSFTFVSREVQEDATAYATQADGTVDFSARRAYLDSIWHEPVYNLLGMEYTYQEVKENELSLGLDLQGGMHVTLEVSPVEIIKGVSGNSQDPEFLKAIELAKERRADSQDRFLELFYEAFVELEGEGQLADVFANAANRERISLTSTDDQVLSVLNEEIEGAIDRSFQILRTRIDRFGTSQPNIQRLQGTGRIQVELPGVDNEERVRKLLQGTAKLEFLDVVELNNISQILENINTRLVNEKRAQAATATPETEVAEEDAVVTEGDSLANALSQDDTTADGDLASQLAEEGGASDSLDLEVSPLFSLIKMRGGLIYSVQDTAKINNILEREDVQDMLPANLAFLWSVKPFSPEGSDEQLLELHAVQYDRGGVAPLGGEVISDARQEFDERGMPAVSMTMDAEGARAWKRLTANNIGERIAIVLDDYVYSAPVVQGEIAGGTSSITGKFTVEEAKDLANILKAGALPAPANIVEEGIVGPTLGKQAQAQGILSMVAGLAIVVLFIIIYYAKGGLVANIALLFNIFFVFGILAQLDAALTLPGIAGIVLTIGMSIDANVLIFERIREELRNGSGMANAIKSGYNKAYSSIIDANVTTLLVSIILYVFGQGPVKGFAITLIIGILCSLFTAILITRVIIDWMTKKGDKSNMSFATPFSKNLFAGMNINFIGRRKIAYVVSAVVIAVGVTVMVLQGGLNLGVDFTGGRSYVVTFTEPVVPSKLKVALADEFGNAGTEVKTYGANNVLKITTSYLINEEAEETDGMVEQALVGGIEEFTGDQFVDEAATLEEGQFTISSSSKVGATIADDIVNSSWQSSLFALVIIFLYILIRFNKWQYSAGAIVALAHDVLITLSAFAIAGALGMTYEVDQVFIAAILTIIGYSINDTVVVFDRIREELSLATRGSVATIFNNAINTTLNRTMITSLTTLIVVLILFLFGGEVLKGFSFALLVGIIVGTYSSIFVATPVVVDLVEKEVANTPSQPVKQKA
ncbi:protein translocase subunit SecDF [Nafulsella turpanensis]|uniref:protein translocase subunit SecDF n=1 Tax=Nafulsella turpanensis TaxID=1265690 RepID=UPI000348DE6D|nr:protein translocase subunit SecDF [Nafulsella turpanensis]